MIYDDDVRFDTHHQDLIDTFNEFAFVAAETQMMVSKFLFHTKGKSDQTKKVKIVFFLHIKKIHFRNFCEIWFPLSVHL